MCGSAGGVGYEARGQVKGTSENVEAPLEPEQF